MAEFSLPFMEPVKGVGRSLRIDPTKPAFEALTVSHPGCETLADVSAELDAFYCPTCRYSGRVSGAWALDELEVHRA